MKPPGRTELPNDQYGGAWGQQVSEIQRPLAVLESQGLATPERLAFARCV